MNKQTATTSVELTPKLTAAINRAYAEACDIIAAEGGQEDLRPSMARYMLELVQRGEKDEKRLCSLSVVAVLGRKPKKLR